MSHRVKVDPYIFGGLIFTLVVTAAVLLHGFFGWVPWSAAAIGIGAGYARQRWLLRIEMERVNEKEPETRPDRWAWAGLIMVTGLQTLITLSFIVQRTDRALASPWEVVSNHVFFLFGLAWYGLLLMHASVSPRIQMFLFGWQVFLSCGVSLCIYKLGFGFDPFIHQAATRSLVERGDIHLPSVLYTGQYAFEAGVARLTGMSVRAVDQVLVPLLATGVIARVIPSIHRYWGRAYSATWIWSVLLLSFLPLTFTVPYHLSYIALLIAVFMLPYILVAETTDHQCTRLMSGLAFAGLLVLVTGLIHPLLAIPSATLIAFGWLAKRWPRAAGIGAFVCTFFLLGLAFYVYVHRLGGTMIWPTKADWRVGLASVTGFPYHTVGWPWYVQWFYRFFHVWPVLVCVFGWWGYQRLAAETRFLRWVYPCTGLAMVVTAMALAASTRFTNIISTEQFEFALRLRGAAPLFFLPGFVIWLDDALERIPNALRPLAYLKIAVMLVAVWFLSYPQANAYVRISAPGLSHADIDTVKTIERLAAGKPYVALTSQMISAAALDQLGFDRELSTPIGPRYAYAIPTGGEFYTQYLRLWYEPKSALVISTARELSGQQQVFIAIPRALDPRGVLDQRLRAVPSSTHEVVDGVVDVYRFGE